MNDPNPPRTVPQPETPPAPIRVPPISPDEPTTPLYPDHPHPKPVPDPNPEPKPFPPIETNSG